MIYNGFGRCKKKSDAEILSTDLLQNVLKYWRHTYVSFSK